MKLDSNYRMSAPLKVFLIMNNIDSEQRKLLQQAEYQFASHKRKRLIKPVADDSSDEE